MIGLMTHCRTLRRLSLSKLLPKCAMARTKQVLGKSEGPSDYRSIALVESISHFPICRLKHIMGIAVPVLKSSMCLWWFRKTPISIVEDDITTTTTTTDLFPDSSAVRMGY